MQRVAAHPRVLLDTVWPAAGVAREVVLILGGSLLIALAAQVAFPLPFTPVPVTGQTFAVLLLGAALGSRRGAASAATYLVIGAIGLPVFAPGGAIGLARLVGPTAGYLAGYVPAAFIAGWLSERGWDRKPWSAAAAMIVANAVIYATGVLWLSRFVGWDNVARQGVVPFLPGDGVKIACATILLPIAWKVMGRRSTSIADQRTQIND